MASIRKRTWQSGGETKTAWLVDYKDGSGSRRFKTFDTKKAGDAWLVQARSQVVSGIHTPESTSLTVAEAAKKWLQRGDLEGLERSTLDKYRNHVELHIVPVIGSVKLAKLSTPMVEAFKDDLLARLSRPMAKKVVSSLKAILSESQRRGLVAQNVAQPVQVKVKGRDDAKLAVGVDIPEKAEIAAILQHASGRWRPFIVTAIFTGMRASEMRGLRWSDVDFGARMIRVSQRADQWGDMGSPKSAAGHREIPASPMVINVLKEWRLACPKSALDLVFPNGAGNVENHANVVNRGLEPILIAAGCALPEAGKKDEDGKPVMHGKYGLHSFRHFFASWAIEQGFSPKKLQALLGHSSIQMTFDRYGHLFPSTEDDHAKFAAGELALVN
jgi:integrase